LFRKIDDFLENYQILREGTQKVFKQLTQDNMDQSINAGFRSLQQLAWHIVVSVPEMMSRTGLWVSSIKEDSMPPQSVNEIVEGYKKVTDELVKEVKTKWTDSTLLETDDMYGQKWQRGKTLYALIGHEIHHVGQMTVLLRQAGAKVPGLYGPSKEEWSQYGMDAPPY
jgi:uncharacterized damage-inducible protein DinB